MEEQHRRVALERIVHELGRLLGHLQLRRNANLDHWPVVQIDTPKLEVHFLGFARVDVRLDDQLLPFLPLAGDRCDQRALERCPAFRLEDIHDGQADQLARFCDLEMPQPRVVDFREDAFLHERVGVRRGSHVIL